MNNMLVETARFGSIEIEADKIISFKDGIPGFEDLTKFVLCLHRILAPFTYFNP